MGRQLKDRLELLAPAGSKEAFLAAVDGGADAVYLGAPGFNARSITRELTFEDIAAMIDHAHGRGVKVYGAMNSLVRERDLEKALATIFVLARLGIDGLIVQDLGVYHLARNAFPELPLHASTLMAAHNSAGVKRLERLGFDRVVLARELTIDEIRQIRKQTSAVLEVFVHGAMCFSYSGLCLFSSYLGGKSGLFGQCVQPCRRRYRSVSGPPGEEGYLFSMGDLCGIEFLEALADAGVGSLKIEGRMRSARYVRRVVEAYRLVLDAPPSGRPQAVAEAKRLLSESMGRRLTQGFFASNDPQDLIQPRWTGNTGRYLGRVEEVRSGRMVLAARAALANGDRLRVAHANTGERTGFTASGLKRLKGNRWSLSAPPGVAAGDLLYRVDEVQGRREDRLLKLKTAGYHRKIEAIKKDVELRRSVGALLGSRKRSSRGRRQGKGMGLWLKSDDPAVFSLRPPPVVRALAVALTQEMVEGGKRRRGKGARLPLVWVLPPVIQEAELPWYREKVAELVSLGQNRWMIGNLGQLEFFEELGERRKGRKELEFFGDASLNVINHLAQDLLSRQGLKGVLASMETDRETLEGLAARAGAAELGLVVYSRPVLSVARVRPGFLGHNRVIASPRGERFRILRRQNLVEVVAEEPFSLLPWLDELNRAGFSFGVLDLSRMKPTAKALSSLLARRPSPRQRRVRSFNFLRSAR